MLDAKSARGGEHWCFLGIKREHTRKRNLHRPLSVKTKIKMYGKIFGRSGKKITSSDRFHGGKKPSEKGEKNRRS